MGLPESYFCEEHGRTHKKGSAIYDSCLPDEFKDEPEAEELEAEEAELEAELEEAEAEAEEEQEPEPESEPEPVEAKPKKAYVPPDKAGPGEVLFRLKDESPQSVTVRTGSYDRTFSRTEQPFVANAVIFEKVLLPSGFFEKA